MRYVPLENLIGHCYIRPVLRTFCPGPAFDYAAIAAAATPAPLAFIRRYRVTAGGATIRQAWWREKGNIAGQLAPSTLVEVDSLHVGEVVQGDDLWLHLSSGAGFVHSSALKRA